MSPYHGPLRHSPATLGRLHDLRHGAATLTLAARGGVNWCRIKLGPVPDGSAERDGMPIWTG